MNIIGNKRGNMWRPSFLLWHGAFLCGMAFLLNTIEREITKEFEAGEGKKLRRPEKGKVNVMSHKGAQEKFPTEAWRDRHQ